MVRGHVVQTSLEHGITNTSQFSRRFQYCEFKTIAQVAPDSFPFFFPPAVLALEWRKHCYSTVWWIQWFVSCVSKTSWRTKTNCHTFKNCIAFVTFSVISMRPRHVTRCQWKQQNCRPASIHDVGIEWFEIHRYQFVAIVWFWWKRTDKWMWFHKFYLYIFYIIKQDMLQNCWNPKRRHGAKVTGKKQYLRWDRPTDSQRHQHLHLPNWQCHPLQAGKLKGSCCPLGIGTVFLCVVVAIFAQTVDCYGFLMFS